VPLVGSNTLGVKTDRSKTQNSKTKEHDGGWKDRCEGAPDVLSDGLLEHLAPPPLSLCTLLLIRNLLTNRFTQTCQGCALPGW
jgi:hypothetical protein